jgi:hypothetical protein
MAQTAEEQSTRKRDKTLAIGYLFLATIFLIVLGVLLFWLPRINDHPQTYQNVPIFPGATSIQVHPGNHDLYKEYTYWTTASFQDVVGYYEDVLRDDHWTPRWREPLKVSFSHEAYREDFHYVAEVSQMGTSGELVQIRLTFICSCFDM